MVSQSLEAIFICFVATLSAVIGPPVVNYTSEKAGHDKELLVNISLLDQLDLKRKIVEKLRGLHRLKRNQSIGYGFLEEAFPKFTADDFNGLYEKYLRKFDKDEEIESVRYREHEDAERRRRMKEYLDANHGHRSEIIKRYKDAARRHKQHEVVHQPGSKEQLEEIWKDEDQMNLQPFNPSVFFEMHDLNSDGVLDIEEIEALLQHDLDKVYNSSDPDFDPYDLHQETIKMRKNFSKSYDSDADYMISKDEFLHGINSQAWMNNKAWETIQDQEDLFYADEANLSKYADRKPDQ